MCTTPDSEAKRCCMRSLSYWSNKTLKPNMSNPGKAAVSLVQYPDADEANCVTETKSLPWYSHALHKSRRHLHLGRIRLVHGSHSYGRIPRTANEHKCYTHPYKPVYRERWCL